MNPNEVGQAESLDTLAPVQGQHTFVVKGYNSGYSWAGNSSVLWKSTGDFNTLSIPKGQPRPGPIKGSFVSCGDFGRKDIVVTHAEEPPELEEFQLGSDSHGNSDFLKPPHQTRTEKGGKKQPFKSKSGEKIDEDRQKESGSQNIDTSLARFEAPGSNFGKHALDILPSNRRMPNAKHLSLTKPQNKVACDIDATTESGNKRVYSATQRLDSNQNSPVNKHPHQVHSIQEIRYHPDPNQGSNREVVMADNSHGAHQQGNVGSNNGTNQYHNDGEEELLSPGSPSPRHRLYEAEAVLEEDHGSDDGDSFGERQQASPQHVKQEQPSSPVRQSQQSPRGGWNYENPEEQVDQTYGQRGVQNAQNRMQSSSAGFLKMQSMNSGEIQEGEYVQTQQHRNMNFISSGNFNLIRGREHPGNHNVFQSGYYEDPKAHKNGSWTSGAHNGAHYQQDGVMDGPDFHAGGMGGDQRSYQAQMFDNEAQMSPNRNKRPLEQPKSKKQQSDTDRVEFFNDLTKKCRDILLNKKSSKKQDQSMLNEECGEIEEDSNDYSLNQIKLLSTESKESSIRVQGYLKARRSNAKQLDAVAAYLCEQGDNILLDKFGNYVMQYLVEIHTPSKDKVSRSTLSDFTRYAENEYGSRIMQKLCSICSDYCKQALGKFKQHFSYLIKNITGSILLSKLISSSKSEQWYSWTIDILAKESELLKKAYFNRMLSTLVHHCSHQVLSAIIEMIKPQIWILMNDKFGNYVLQIILEKQHAEGTKHIKNTCLKNCSQILGRKYPKFLIIKLVEVDQAGDFAQNLAQKIVQSDDENVAGIMIKRDSASLLTLILARAVMSSLEKKLSPNPISALITRLLQMFTNRPDFYDLPYCMALY